MRKTSPMDASTFFYLHVGNAKKRENRKNIISFGQRLLKSFVMLSAQGSVGAG